MWVLTPVIRSGASQRPSDGGAGGSGGDRDAAPQAYPAQALAATPNTNHFLVSGPLVVGRAGAGRGADIEVHGDKSVSAAHATLGLEADPGAGSTVTLTDTSSFGTLVNDKRLPKGQAVRLAADDTLRLADKSKFRLSRAPLALHAPHASTAAAAAADAAALGLPLVPWGPSVSHCVVEEGGEVGAALACALLAGVPLVTPAWLAAIRSRKVWPGALPHEVDHQPCELALARLHGQQRGAALRLAEWRVPPEGALGTWAVAFEQQDAALTELACLAGAQVVAPWWPGAAPPAVSGGRTLICVASSSCKPDGGEALKLGAPSVDVATLVHAALLGDAASLQSAARAYWTAAEEAAAAAEQGGTQGTAPGGEEGDSGEGDDGETTLLEVSHPRQRRGAAVSGRSQGDAQPGDGTAASPATAAAAAAAQPGGGKAGGSSGGGRKRRGDAKAADPPAGGGPASKRARQADGTADASDAAAHEFEAGGERGGAQQQAQPDGGQTATNTGEGRPQIAVEQLIVVGPSRGGGAQGGATGGKAARGRAGARDSGSNGVAAGVPNFKAFRRKGQGRAAAGASGSGLHVSERALLEVYTDQRRMDAEAQAYAKEEQLRAKRMKKADELFNANIRPAKAAPVPKPPPAKRRVVG